MSKSTTPERGPEPPLDRFVTLNTFVDRCVAKLAEETGSSNASLLWFVLFRLANGKTGFIPRGSASERQLSKLTGLSRMTVRRAIQKLKESELLFVEQGSTVRQAPSYRLWHAAKEAKPVQRQRASG